MCLCVLGFVVVGALVNQHLFLNKKPNLLLQSEATMNSLKRIITVLLLTTLGVGAAVCAFGSTTYTVQSDNTAKITVHSGNVRTTWHAYAFRPALPMFLQQPSTQTSSQLSGAGDTIIAHLAVTSTTVYFGQDVKIIAKLSQPVSGLTLTLRFMDANQPTFNAEDEAYLQATIDYILSSQCQTTATTNWNGVAVFDLGTGLPVTQAPFDAWHFNIMPQSVTN
jgi:hypothetical protein